MGRAIRENLFVHLVGAHGNDQHSPQVVCAEFAAPPRPEVEAFPLTFAIPE
jgi:hypothetical protein